MSLDRIAQEWVRGAALRLETESFVQADLDEFTGLEIPKDAAQQALALFVVIANFASKITPAMIAMVIFPLPASGRLLTRPSSFPRLLARPWASIEPPGFYLTRPDLWSKWEDVEEYRIPVEQALSAEAPVHCYYRSFRNAEARQRGWEYTRAFYLRTD